MFALKKDIENWCQDFLKKNDAGQYVCPFESVVVRPIKTGAYWKIEGRNEEWIWEVEELKNTF